ncbi:MAG: DUF427 domain-containing protein [Myxococcota bacterium]
MFGKPRFEDFDRSRAAWRWRGQARPDFAEAPGPDQESVWDYPRPPSLEPVRAALRVQVGETVVAETRRGLRICETASAPTYYFPLADVRMELLEDQGPSSLCEWKGVAHVHHVRVEGALLRGAAWRYPEPWPGFELVAETMAFHPAHVRCFIGDEEVTAQPGGLYGGWVTTKLAGPIKGGPGTGGW